MTVALEPVARRVPHARRGWRPRGHRLVCSLGWDILDWTYASLPDPRDASRPLILTNEQARRVVRIYELDPLTGRRLFTRVHQEEAKGWGKGPLAAVLALAEFGGAGVVFDGWDADGQPVGKPWGSPGLPVPYAQVVAVSEAQTFNVWAQVMTFAAGARGDLARVITVDSGRPGRTMLRRRDIPAAELARVTASAVSREGALVVHAILDEVQLWTEANGGDELVRVVLRNLDKSGGWAHFLGNAPVLGRGTMAEAWGDPVPDALHFATRPSETPEQGWTPERLRAALAEVYADVPWIDLDRQLASLSLAQVPWADTLRFKFNIRVDGVAEDAWLDADDWDACADDMPLSPREPAYASVRVARDYRSAAVALAQRQGEDVVLRCRTWEADDLAGGEPIDLADIEAHLIGLRRTFPARVIADVQYRPGGKAHRLPRPGPEVTYHGSYFERSRQSLEQAGVVMVQVPDSPAAIAPAAAQLRGLVTERRLHHDGDEVLARHVASVVAKETQAGAVPQAPDDPHQRTEAALAAMHAVHRAMTAPRPPSRKVRGPL